MTKTKAGMIGYCGGSKEVFNDGVREGEIWTKVSENGVTMYQTYQFNESHKESTRTIEQGIMKYNSIKDKTKFKQLIQGLMDGKGSLKVPRR